MRLSTLRSLAKAAGVDNEILKSDEAWDDAVKDHMAAQLDFAKDQVVELEGEPIIATWLSVDGRPTSTAVIAPADAVLDLIRIGVAPNFFLGDYDGWGYKVPYKSVKIDGGKRTRVIAIPRWVMNASNRETVRYRTKNVLDMRRSNLTVRDNLSWHPERRMRERIMPTRQASPRFNMRSAIVPARFFNPARPHQPNPEGLGVTWKDELNAKS